MVKPGIRGHFGRFHGLFQQSGSLVGVVCVLAAGLAMIGLVELDRVRLAGVVATDVAALTNRLQDRLRLIDEPVDELYRFYSSSNSVDLGDFATFTKRQTDPENDDFNTFFPVIGWYETSSPDEVSIARGSNSIVTSFRAENLRPEIRDALSQPGAMSFRNHPFMQSTFEIEQLAYPDDFLITLASGLDNTVLNQTSKHVGFVFATVNISALVRDLTIDSGALDLEMISVLHNGETFDAFRSKTPVDSDETDRQVVRADANGFEIELSVLPRMDNSLFAIVDRHWVKVLTILVFFGLSLGFGLMSARRGDAEHRARSAAERANRQKSRFLATMSHEIRTPLNGILGMSDLVQKGDLSSRQRQHMITLNKSAEGLLGIINEILDFSKIESEQIDLNPEETDLAELVDQTVRNANVIAAAQGVELLLEYPWVAPQQIFVDGMRLRQILTNLLSNAVKFTLDGHVSLRISGHDNLQGSTQRVLVFEIKDTGVGIEPEKLKAIFKPFIQADSSTTRNFGGTGLGLSISDQLIRLMGGTIEASSVVGEGSCFTLTLPVDVIPAENRNRREVAIAVSLRYLLVTDNQLLGASAVATISSVGAEVVTAKSISQARPLLENTETGDDPFDVVLIDHAIIDSQMVAQLRQFQGGYPLIVVDLRSSLQVLMARESNSVDGETTAISFPILPEHFARRIAQSFRKELSLAPPENLASQDCVEDEQSTDPDLQGAKVLLVEDDRVNQMYAEEILESFGCTVMTCDNGQAALQTLETNDFDVVLMDCQMPVMDGYTASARIRDEVEAGRRLDVPVIALTANAIKGDKERCLTAGMSDYLSKPVREQQLLGMLKRWVQKSARVPIVEPLELTDSVLALPTSEQITNVSFATLTGYSSEEVDYCQPTDPTQEIEYSGSIRVPKDERVGRSADEVEFDLDLFMEARETIGNRLPKLVQMFCEDGQMYIANLRSAIHKGDFETCVKVAHTLKSTSKILGASRLSILASSVEEKAKNGDTNVDQIRLLADEMQSAFDSAMKSITNEINAA